MRQTCGPTTDPGPTSTPGMRLALMPTRLSRPMMTPSLSMPLGSFSPFTWTLTMPSSKRRLAVTAPLPKEERSSMMLSPT